MSTGTIRRGAVAIRRVELDQKRNAARVGKEIRAKRAKEKAHRMMMQESREAKAQHNWEIEQGWR